MGEDLLDHYRLADAGERLDAAVATLAGFGVILARVRSQKSTFVATSNSRPI